MKRLIITGISEGLGYEVGKLALEKGYKVLGIARNKPDLDIDFIKTDLSKEEDLDKLIHDIKENYSDFSALINIAGILNIREPKEVDYKESLELFKINVHAPIYLTSKPLDLVIKNEADILNTGSTVGFKGYKNQAYYGTSKWAIRGFNEYLRTELNETKSRVIGFNPGGFKSKHAEKVTGVKVEDWSPWMDPRDLAELMITLLETPKKMEVSDIIVNRK